MLSMLGMAEGLAGKREAARTIPEDMMRMPRTTHVSPCYCALIDIGMGHTNRAMDDSYKAHDEHDAILMYCAVDPIAESLQDNSRFDVLLRGLSLRY